MVPDKIGSTFLDSIADFEVKSKNDNEEFATFGAGCYWGTEKWYTDKNKFNH